VKLPSANEAEVPRAKIAHYLLDPNHRAGKSKARFFLSHGFTVERWQELADALRRHVRENDIANQERTPLGERFVVEGSMPLPDGGVASVRSIWFVESGEQVPRLATAYPLRLRKQT